MDAMSSSITAPSPTKSTKRKIDEALHNLDDILRSPDEFMQPPSKKVRFPGTLYSTLAKYGIKSSKASTNIVSESTSNLENSNIIKRTAPHLSAILSRAATKKRKAAHLEELARATVSNLSASSLHPGASEYRPSSITSFLSRLSTFKLSTYANKPEAIDAVAASKAGWMNDGKDRLVCGICRGSWVVVSRDGMSRDAANTLLEKQRNYLVQMHKDRCPWKAQQCDPTIYCIPLKSPSSLSKEIKRHALDLDEDNAMEGVDIRHPLTSSQVQGLMSALASVRLTFPGISILDDAPPSDAEVIQTEPEMRPEPSQTAALTSLFGWTLVPPAPISDSRPSTPSVSRANSVAPAPSVPGTPRRVSWNSSVSEAGSPGPSRPPLSRPPASHLSSMALSLQRHDSQKECLQCVLCQRRIGLWAFKSNATSTGISTNSTASTVSAATDESISTAPSRMAARRQSQMQMPKRQFDLLKEHRSYCPYVVRSTAVPSLPAPSTAPTSPSPASRASASASNPTRSNSISSFNFSFVPRNAPTYPSSSAAASVLGDTNVVEGWRAVLTVVLRTGLGRRQRQRARAVQTMTIAEGTEQNETHGSEAGQDLRSDATEVDGIYAMVEDVKMRGGKDLLKYVKSLFA
ncbi:zf-C3HC-domain-containing protein [Phellopilus nigrolimitatus]|nr:zf-C3HC-domain-containing protein [Phellopilus nigrolimitatus]